MTRASRRATVLLLAAGLAGPAQASARGPQAAREGTRVSVLGLRSFDARQETLADVTGLLVDRFRAADGILLIDPVGPLVEKGADDWLRADKLLYDGMQDYGALKLDDAIRKLREAADVFESSYREYADAQGGRRMREACLYLGLAHLEQDEAREASEWFERAVTADPSFVPDPRAFPPMVRSRYSEVRDGLSGPAYLASRELLDPMAVRIGADVLVGGGVSRTAAGHDVLEIVIADRWKGRLVVETIPAASGSREDLRAAIDAAMPRLVALALDRPWNPGTARVPRAKGTVGYAMFGVTDLRMDGRFQDREFDYRGPLLLHGMSLGFSPWKRGPWSVETDLSVYAPRAMSGGHFQKPSSAEGRILFAGSISARWAATWWRDGWGISGGAGVAAHELIASFAAPNFASPDTQAGSESFWMAPVATATFIREFGAAGFVKLEIGGEYDALTGPARWSFRPSASGGMSF